MDERYQQPAISPDEASWGVTADTEKGVDSITDEAGIHIGDSEGAEGKAALIAGDEIDEIYKTPAIEPAEPEQNEAYSHPIRRPHSSVLRAKMLQASKASQALLGADVKWQTEMKVQEPQAGNASKMPKAEDPRTTARITTTTGSSIAEPPMKHILRGTVRRMVSQNDGQAKCNPTEQERRSAMERDRLISKVASETFDVKEKAADSLAKNAYGLDVVELSQDN